MYFKISWTTLQNCGQIVFIELELSIIFAGKISHAFNHRNYEAIAAKKEFDLREYQRYNKSLNTSQWQEENVKILFDLRKLW